MYILNAYQSIATMTAQNLAVTFVAAIILAVAVFAAVKRDSWKTRRFAKKQN